MIIDIFRILGIQVNETLSWKSTAVSSDNKQNTGWTELMVALMLHWVLTQANAPSPQ